MPIEIPAGESYTFDVLVRTFASGESSFEFNMFIEANNALYIQPVSADVTVLPSTQQISEAETADADAEAGTVEEGDSADSQSD